MGGRYPDRIPVGLAEVLGMPNFSLAPWAGALRMTGVEVPQRYEGEMSSALHFLIPFAIRHGIDWGASAKAELRRLKEGGAYTTPIIGVMPDGFGESTIVKALDAAVKALRSYQLGNSAPDLAREIADFGDQALVDAGLPKASL